MTRISATLIMVAAVLLLAAVSLCGATAADNASGLPASGNLESKTYTLTDNVQLTGELFVPYGVNAVIDLNGKTITAETGCRVISVQSGGTLTLQDAASGGNITGGSANDGGGVYVNGTFIMNRGSISGNTASGNGGGVYVAGGMFTMNNGYIYNNTASGNGGAVYVGSSGTFRMIDGGTLYYNNAVNGGGVYVKEGGRFSIESGLLQWNIASNNGGAVYNAGAFDMAGGIIGVLVFPNCASENGGGVYNTGTFKMSRGNIDYNTAKKGGGVYNTGTFEMTADQGPLLSPDITGNSAADGGGVHNTGTFTMKGGNINKNKATGKPEESGQGGGVYVNGGTFTMGGGSITDNSANNRGGGVSVENNGKFNVSGASVIKGSTAKKTADNVYLDSNHYITLIGELSGEIFIRNPLPVVGTPVQFGNGIAQYKGADHFVSDWSNIISGFHCVGKWSVDDDGKMILVWDIIPRYLISISPEIQHGTVTTSVPAARLGGEVTLTVIPDGGYQLESLTVSYTDESGTEQLIPVKETTSGSGIFTFIMPSPESTVTAGTYDITVNAVFVKMAVPKKRSSSGQGTSIWLTATPTTYPTVTPTAAPTASPTQEMPTAKPVTTQTPQAKSPGPFIGILAGLGAAAVLFGLRRK